MRDPHFYLVGDYPKADSFRNSVLPLLGDNSGAVEVSNVKAIHTEWDWQSENVQVRNLKTFLIYEIKKNFDYSLVDNSSTSLDIVNFWGNVYNKGDYAQQHNHWPFHYSLVYFLKTKWYYSPLIFTDIGKKVRPKEGRYVIFPAYLNHRVPKHRYNEKRITLSGNLLVQI